MKMRHWVSEVATLVKQKKGTKDFREKNQVRELETRLWTPDCPPPGHTCQARRETSKEGGGREMQTDGHLCK
jgi:hypothetical protein